jgi:predicted ATPase with chaperone activity
MIADTTFQMPAAPQSLDETGLSGDLVLQMVTKTLHFAGELTGTELADRLGVTFPVIEPAVSMLKREHHCEVIGGTILGGPSYTYRLTDAGRVRASIFLENNHYVGALPVPLDQYRSYMSLFTEQRSSLSATREAVRGAFSHLVLNRRVLDQLGPAIAAWHSLFVYGPPGNGKTVISQAIRNILEGGIAIPHAISVDGHIIRVFDPVNHEKVDVPHPDEWGLERIDAWDGRWVPCRRPLVTVGGELTMDALELGYSVSEGFYRAPLQSLANGGVLVIDDFGRQHASPRDLLNRWIVPLESRVDHLTLQTGQKFEVPFEVFVVFATNLKPTDLVDEAFLRRIQYKVLAESPTAEEFAQIFENYCDVKGLAFDPALAEHVIFNELRARGIALRGCQPRDLIEHALALANYLDLPRQLTPDLLSEACASCFVEDRDLTTA